HAVHLVRVVADANAPGGGWMVFKNSWGCNWGDAGYGYLSIGQAQDTLRGLVVIQPRRDVYNVLPELDITAPQDGLTEPFRLGFGGGNEVTLQATVTDDEPDCCDVSWYSNIDGDLGTGNPLAANFHSSGVHTVTATIRDRWGVTASDSITVELTNQAPVVDILEPDDLPGPYGWIGPRVPHGARLPLVGDAFDPNNLFLDPPCNQRRWTLDGASLGSGCSRVAVMSELGFQRIRHTAEDNEGAVGEHSHWVRVVDWGPTDPPWVRVTAPLGLPFAILDTETVTVDAEVVSLTDDDAELRWTLTNIVTGATLDLGSARTFVLDPDALNIKGVYDLEIEATNAHGSARHTVQIEVYELPS
ncbi:MAG: hypothetical protein AAF602_16805, partial [Myxococcota bacterium]